MTRLTAGTISFLSLENGRQYFFTRSLPKEMLDALEFHNTKRQEVGVNALTWSDELAQLAQDWADHLAEFGEIDHRPNNKYGENVAFDSSVLAGAERWYSEIQKYTHPTKINGTNYLTFGHYTQMVWKGSTQIGIGVAEIKEFQPCAATRGRCTFISVRMRAVPECRFALADGQPKRGCAISDGPV
jgi:uncharacterized protein YkwD